MSKPSLPWHWHTMLEVSLLIGAGADPRIVDNQGVSLLELARKPDVKDIIALDLAQNA